MLVVTMESRGLLNYHNGLLTVMKGFFCGTAPGADSEGDVKCESFSKVQNSDQGHL
jgi:hypothetical protein